MIRHSIATVGTNAARLNNRKDAGKKLDCSSSPTGESDYGITFPLLYYNLSWRSRSNLPAGCLALGIFYVIAVCHHRHALHTIVLCRTSLCFLFFKPGWTWYCNMVEESRMHLLLSLPCKYCSPYPYSGEIILMHPHLYNHNWEFSGFNQCSLIYIIKNQKRF